MKYHTSHSLSLSTILWKREEVQNCHNWEFGAQQRKNGGKIPTLPTNPPNEEWQEHVIIQCHLSTSTHPALKWLQKWTLKGPEKVQPLKWNFSLSFVRFLGKSWQLFLWDNVDPGCEFFLVYEVTVRRNKGNCSLTLPKEWSLLKVICCLFRHSENGEKTNPKPWRCCKWSKLKTSYCTSSPAIHYCLICTWIKCQLSCPETSGCYDT